MSYLIDTDVLIDFLRGRGEAVSAVEDRLLQSYLSVITVAELYQGVREGKERTLLSKTLSAITQLPVSAEIAERAGLMSRDYRKSHGCGLADCLIAATAEWHGLIILTLNSKHYPMLNKVKVPYRKPAAD